VKYHKLRASVELLMKLNKIISPETLLRLPFLSPRSYGQEMEAFRNGMVITPPDHVKRVTWTSSGPNKTILPFAAC
jgi:hypothetical protein